MSEEVSPIATALTADELADKRIMKQLTICIVAMMGIAAIIVTTANAIA